MLNDLSRVLVAADRAAPEQVHPTFRDQCKYSLEQAETADVVLFGVPFDGGTHTHVGTHEGPMGIRDAFGYFRTYSVELGFDFADVLTVADIGNISIEEWRTYDEAFKGVTEVVTEVARAGKVPVMLGGDHSIAYPAVRAFAETSPGRIGLIWIDNHYDAWEPFRGDPFHCGCPLRNLVMTLPKKLAAENVVHIGSRGFGNSAASAKNAAELGINLVPVSRLDTDGAVSVAKEAMERAWRNTSGVYVSVDLDAADVVYAPGTQSSRPGGLTAREMMALVRECAVGGARAFDVVECAPRADIGQATAMLGAELVLEAIGGVAARTHPSQASLAREDHGATEPGH